MKKIDIHCHTTNRIIKDIIPKSANIEAVLANMDMHEIETTVLMASYFPHKSSGISNFRLLHWIKDHPQLCMYGSLDFEFYFHQGLNELNELAESQLIKGIKIYTGYQNIESGKLKKVLDIAREYSLPIAFHTGVSYSAFKKYGKLAITKIFKPDDMETIARENSDLTFILCHMGKPFFDDTIKAIKAQNNIYTDVSGLIASTDDRTEIPRSIEAIQKFLGECGPKKLIFGTDFPVQTHEDSINFIEESMKNYSSEDKTDVYYNNAKKILEAKK